MSLRALTQPIARLNWILKRGQGVPKGYTLNTPCFMIPWPPDSSVGFVFYKNLSGKKREKNAGKIIGELWEIPPADLENQDTLPFCKKSSSWCRSQQICLQDFAPNQCVFLWFVAPSPKFGFLAVACGCRAPLVVALRNRRYSRNGCHHIIAHVPLVSTLLKASHKMQPNCVQRKREQQIFSYRFADHKGKTAFMEREENYQDWFAVMISHSCTCSMQMVVQSVPLFHQYVTTINWQQKPGWKIFTLSAQRNSCH